MQIDEFDYALPPGLIAQEPPAERGSSRLLTVDRRNGAITATRFTALVELLQEGDLLVLNDTRVIPARLHGHKESGGRIEIFLVRKAVLPGQIWQCLLRSSKPSRPGDVIRLAEGVTAKVLGRDDGETWTVSFSTDAGFGPWLERTGSMPLPPYIKREAVPEDRERYQTVFALNEGAVAAPTAGLHFTPHLLDLIRLRGVDIATITLHVGLGTFLPLRVTDVRDHRMHRECILIPDATATLVNERKRTGGRVVAVGTTVVRALEHAAGPDGILAAGNGEADIFIYPGYRFRVVDALLTNFHLPKSSLLMLAAAFAGKETLFRAYDEAIRQQFRFFSYGDAMFIF
jgi:S-adenosylmethionine:tRNA ribosyltransferase-isomerase